MVALIGDAEMDEGNIYEALLEGWKQGVENLWWIIDYNRQSLDAIAREGLFSRLEALFEAFGWNVVVMKYGVLQQAAFAEPGGEKFARMDRWVSQFALFLASVSGRRGVAQTPDRRTGRPGSGERAVGQA